MVLRGYINNSRWVSPVRRAIHSRWASQHEQQQLTVRPVGVVRQTKLAAPVTLRHLLQLRTQALGVENQGASVAAQQVAAVRANLAEVVVILRGGDDGSENVARPAWIADRAGGVGSVRLRLGTGRWSTIRRGRHPLAETKYQGGA